MLFVKVVKEQVQKMEQVLRHVRDAMEKELLEKKLEVSLAPM